MNTSPENHRLTIRDLVHLIEYIVGENVFFCKYLHSDFMAIIPELRFPF